MPPIRVVLDLTGVLQGVGMRPTMQVQATRAGLGGWVQNRAGSVRLALEGPAEAVDAFIGDLPARLPRQARLEAAQEVSREALPGDGVAAPFRILDSAAGDEVAISIPADLAICPACRRDISDPASRFFGYPFTTCTDCGPRYTVVEGMPYDRDRTTLSVFPLCPACRGEYEDPVDRRFHAESLACSECGPSLTWIPATSVIPRLDRGIRDAGSEGAGPTDAPVKPGHDKVEPGYDRVEPGHDEESPLRAARRALHEGQIVAVRGLGGFLLACDARERETVARLRERKRRPHKPLAVMARELEVAGRLGPLPRAMSDLMSGPVAPICILDVDPARADALPLDLLSPDAPTLGVMLPTSALHALLATPLPGDPTPPLDWLVMTSGNRRAEPICLSTDEALEHLAGVADAFLTHDREVRLRADDSLVAWQQGAAQVWRRARGYAPEAIRLAAPLTRRVLAMGAELKNAVALGDGDRVVLSPHVGDLETPEALDGHEQAARLLPAYLRQAPEAVAVDLHPDMHATRTGRRIAADLGLPLVEVQHHHAHAAACLAEHGLSEGLALAFDGTGLGPDGTIWGAELLHLTPAAYERLGTFAPTPLPGGDAAVRHPARQVVARWAAQGLEAPAARLRAWGVDPEQAALWSLAARRGLHAPLTHAAGRLFDAASVLAGCSPAAVSYEGQAAVRLEALALRAQGLDERNEIEFSLREEGRLLVVDWAPLFARALAGAPRDPAAFALGFHHAVAQAAVMLAAHGRRLTGSGVVGLTGGVFQNRLLTGLACEALSGAGFDVRLHRLVPPNDGGVALGQAVIAGG